MTDSACLAGDTAALSCANDIEFAHCFCNSERLVYDELECFEAEVIINIAAIDCDSACAGVYTNTSNRFFSSTCTIEVRFSTCVCHLQLLPFSVNNNCCGLLCLLIVFSACVNFEACERFVTDVVVGKHAFNSKFHSELGFCSHKLSVACSLEAADVTGVTVVEFLVELLTCENSFGSVYDDNVFAAVNMRCELGAMFTSENVSSSNSNFAEGLICCVDYVPLTFESFGFSHKSGHCFFLRIIYL